MNYTLKLGKCCCMQIIPSKSWFFRVYDYNYQLVKCNSPQKNLQFTLINSRNSNRRSTSYSGIRTFQNEMQNGTIYNSTVQHNFPQWWKCSISVLSNPVDASYMWLLNTWNVTVANESECVNLFLITVNLINSYM